MAWDHCGMRHEPLSTQHGGRRLVDSWRRARNNEGMKSEIISIAKGIRRHPWLAERILVFGSAVTRPDEARDLDLCLVVSSDDSISPRLPGFMGSLLATARQRYGSFDPFMLREGYSPGHIKDQLWVRNDEATGWIKSKNAKAVMVDIRAGEVFGTWFDRVVNPRLNPDTLAPFEPGAEARSRGVRPR